MATNYENQKGFYENVKLDENGYMLVTGISGGGGATGPAGTSGTSGVNGSAGSNGTSGTSGSDGTSGTSPSGGAAGLIAGVGLNSIQSNTTLTPGASASTAYSIVLGSTASTSNSYDIAIGTNLIVNSRDVDNNPDGRGIVLGVNSTLSPWRRKGVVIGNSSYGYNGGVVVGDNNNASGDGSIVVGRGNSATNDGGIVFGYDNSTVTAAGAGTNIMVGVYNQVSGYYSSVFGIGSIASNRALALGFANSASGLYSFAAGGTNISATHDNSIVFGSNNSSVVPNHLHISGLYIYNANIYADNAAAITGGLVAGQIYRTSIGQLMIVY